MVRFHGVNDAVAEIDKSAVCNLPCSEHVPPKYPGAQLHVLLATQTPVPLAHGGHRCPTKKGATPGNQ